MHPCGMSIQHLSCDASSRGSAQLRICISLSEALAIATTSKSLTTAAVDTAGPFAQAVVIVRRRGRSAKVGLHVAGANVIGLSARAFLFYVAAMFIGIFFPLSPSPASPLRRTQV